MGLPLLRVHFASCLVLLKSSSFSRGAIMQLHLRGIGNLKQGSAVLVEAANDLLPHMCSVVAVNVERLCCLAVADHDSEKIIVEFDRHDIVWLPLLFTQGRIIARPGASVDLELGLGDQDVLAAEEAQEQALAEGLAFRYLESHRRLL